MAEPTITVPWTDDSMEMLDWSKVKVNGELATDLLAQRDALRARVAELECYRINSAKFVSDVITGNDFYREQLRRIASETHTRLYMQDIASEALGAGGLRLGGEGVAVLVHDDPGRLGRKRHEFHGDAAPGVQAQRRAQAV